MRITACLPLGTFEYLASMNGSTSPISSCENPQRQKHISQLELESLSFESRKVGFRCDEKETSATNAWGVDNF